MEFEKDAPVSDDQRRLAEVKKITLQPSSVDIAPEDISESEIASSHINGQPLGNIHGSIKQDPMLSSLRDETTSSNTPTTHKQATKMITVIVGTALVLIIGSLLFIFAIIS